LVEFVLKENVVNRQHPQEPDEETLQRIRQHLQQPEAQERIREYGQNARTKATVTTSRAAELLGLGQQQLRDWDNRGLIKTERTSIISSEEGKPSKGHRQFTLDELDKLAIIKELTDKGNVTPGDLLPYIEKIWHEALFAEQKLQVEPQQQAELLPASITINQRIRNERARLFWRFYASHALRISLFLIREDKPAGTIGLILPLRKQGTQVRITRIDDLHMLRESLVGWLNQGRFTHTMLTATPSFEYSTDYRIQPLTSTNENTSQDTTHIIVLRDADPLILSPEIVEIVCMLLRPVYENVEHIESCFGLDMYDMIDTTPAQEQTALFPNLILNGLANMIVHLGNSASEENSSDRWRFCCILLPRDSRLPIQERTLVVRAQSQYSPHKIGVSSVPPDLNSLSLHAFQSGLVCYRDKLSPKETIIAYRDLERSINSAIAVPVGGEDGDPLGAIYVTSEYESAFSGVQDRRLLRILSRMVVELVRTYQFRWQEIDKLEDMLRHPDVVDDLLGTFPSENDFIRDLEGFLRNQGTSQTQLIQQQAIQQELASFEENQSNEEEAQSEVHAISLIGIDVDHVTRLALKYGDRAVRNLCKEIGLRINGELASTFQKYPGCQFYHIVSDRFYVLLKNVPFDQVRKKARLLRKACLTLTR
jgi:GGDEF domain-containing protein